MFVMFLKKLKTDFSSNFFSFRIWMNITGFIEHVLENLTVVSDFKLDKGEANYEQITIVPFFNFEL